VLGRGRRRRRALAVLAAAVALPGAGLAVAGLVDGPRDGWFAEDSFWNAPLADDAPLHPRSRLWTADLRRQVDEHGVWVNTREFSTAVVRVDGDQPRVRVRLDRSSRSAPTRSLRRALERVPIPPSARPAAGTDRHLVVWQPETDTMWEFWVLRRERGGWVADWGARIDGVSEHPGTPDGERRLWGATATSLPLAGGLITLHDLREGRIDHAVALALPEPGAAFLPPARRSDGDRRAARAVPEGARFRLPASLDLDALGLTPFARMVAEAAQRHGMIVRDRAGAVVLFGEEGGREGAHLWAEAFEGRYPDDALRGFPWDRLQVVRP
jgi:hypothetical protein